MTDDAPDHAARYVALQARAREVNHHLRVTIIAGPENPSEEVVMVPLIPQPGDLPAALDAIEGYLDGPDAKRRGELYAERDAKAAAYVASLAATTEARAAWRAAVEAVDKDTDRARFPDEQDDDEVVTNVGPDQQGDAHRLAQEHAQDVARQAGGETALGTSE